MHKASGMVSDQAERYTAVLPTKSVRTSPAAIVGLLRNNLSEVSICLCYQFRTMII